MKHDTKNNIKGFSILIISILMIYLGICWYIFEWRNPLCNETAAIKNFKAVITFQKLEIYQYKGE